MTGRSRATLSISLYSRPRLGHKWRIPDLIGAGRGGKKRMEGTGTGRAGRDCG
jgi:hypothetical protein